MYPRPDKCERCGLEFTDRWPRSDRKYCANKCRQAAYRKRRFRQMIAARDQLRAKAEAAREAYAKKKKARGKRSARAKVT